MGVLPERSLQGHVYDWGGHNRGAHINRLRLRNHKKRVSDGPPGEDLMDVFNAE
jgi:hypothetical protein